MKEYRVEVVLVSEAQGLLNTWAQDGWEVKTAHPAPVMEKGGMLGMSPQTRPGLLVVLERDIAHTSDLRGS